MNKNTQAGKAIILALLLIAAAAAYPVVLVQNSGQVVVTRATDVQKTPNKRTTTQGDYFVGFEDGYQAGYLDGRSNKHSRSNPCIYAPYVDCTYYSAEDYPYNLYKDYYSIYYPTNVGKDSQYQVRT